MIQHEWNILIWLACLILSMAGYYTTKQVWNFCYWTENFVMALCKQLLVAGMKKPAWPWGENLEQFRFKPKEKFQGSSYSFQIDTKTGAAMWKTVRDTQRI